MCAQDASIFQKFKRRHAYEAFPQLKEEGKIKHFGISFHIMMALSGMGSMKMAKDNVG